MTTCVDRRVSLGLAMAAGLAVSVFVSPALGQGTRRNQPNTQQTTPTPAAGQPAAAQPGGQQAQEPALGPYVTVSSPRDITVTALVRLNSEASDSRRRHVDPRTKRTVDMPEITPFEFTTARFVWPLALETASSSMFPDRNVQAQAKGVTPFVMGRLTVNDAEVDVQGDLLTGYPGPTSMIALDAKGEQKYEARQLQMEVVAPVRAWRTEYDERSANKVPWPSRWPKEVADVLTPQAYIEFGYNERGERAVYDDKGLTDALAAWYTEERITDPKRFGPALIAKLIAHRVWGTVQVDDEGVLSRQNTGEFAGFDLQTPADTLATGRGSPHDIAVLTAALMRKAGIPARVVIGVDTGSGRSSGIKRTGDQNRLRSWVEFYLYDEAQNVANWVPVDVVRLRESSSRPRGLDTPWEYFGSHDELDRVAPVSFHFHPPTDVTGYGAPALWGWFVTPRPPAQGLVALTVTGVSTSSREARERGMSIKDERMQEQK